MTEEISAGFVLLPVGCKRSKQNRQTEMRQIVSEYLGEFPLFRKKDDGTPGTKYEVVLRRRDEKEKKRVVYVWQPDESGSEITCEAYEGDKRRAGRTSSHREVFDTVQLLVDKGYELKLGENPSGKERPLRK